MVCSTWTQEWRDIIFSDGSRFCFQHHDDHILVWWHRDEGTLRACIQHRHNGPSPLEWRNGVFFNANFNHLLFAFKGTLDSGSYISVVLKPVALLFIPALQKLSFHQDNARPHATGLPQCRKCLLATLTSRSFTIRKHLNDNCPKIGSTPCTNHYRQWTVASYWAAWTAVIVHAIQSLYDSKPRISMGESRISIRGVTAEKYQGSIFVRHKIL